MKSGWSVPETKAVEGLQNKRKQRKHFLLIGFITKSVLASSDTFCLITSHTCSTCSLWIMTNNLIFTIGPFHNMSAPTRLCLPVPHVSTKPLKSSLSFQTKILFYIWNKQIKYCSILLWSKLICVTCKLLMSGYLDIKSLHPHLKVNWNVLMCKICIARRLIVDIFPWCNANFVPFPSRTLVERRMGNGSILYKKFRSNAA